jgi:hypothetical protein
MSLTTNQIKRHTPAKQVINKNKRLPASAWLQGVSRVRQRGFQFQPRKVP